MRVLACAALRDDVIIVLHQDRRDHVLMNFSQDIDKHTPEEQQAWGLFVSIHSSIKELLLNPYSNPAKQFVREPWTFRVAFVYF